ncbi:unnamed protein product [Spirodela intermedia]|uniref:Small ribosomal subunit protein cS22 n=2 Tax=Spirodela intermedia TaxID=51605 RepID=A0A7I8IVI2_SPIIN|nr:unnamed protein product [Spirodela intermedia]CAA6661593.1 unnamed protein product [Spirodela intermedia]CAA7397970.1 unnamed protein product [Spirodela intermedia]
MAAISSLASPHLLQRPSNAAAAHKIPLLRVASFGSSRVCLDSPLVYPLRGKRSLGTVCVVAQEASGAVQDLSSEAARRLYVGNIPRNVSNQELSSIFGEHGSVEKAEVMYDKYSGRSRRFAFVTMSSVEDANAAIEKLNGSDIGGRQIKVNVTEKPLQSLELSLPQVDESSFVDSPFKVYVGNLTKNVTSEVLTKFFSERGKVLSAKVSRAPGTSKSSGFGFVTFSSEEDVETAIESANNAFLEGQRIRVNKA